MRKLLGLVYVFILLVSVVGCAPSLLEQHDARMKARDEFIAKLKKYSHLTPVEKNKAYAEELSLLENIKDIDLRSDIGAILGDAIAQNGCDNEIILYYEKIGKPEQRTIWDRCYKQHLEMMEAIDKKYEKRLKRLYDSWPRPVHCSTQIFGNLAYTNCY